MHGVFSWPHWQEVATMPTGDSGRQQRRHYAYLATLYMIREAMWRRRLDHCAESVEMTYADLYEPPVVESGWIISWHVARIRSLYTSPSVSFIPPPSSRSLAALSVAKFTFEIWSLARKRNGLVEGVYSDDKGWKYFFFFDAMQRGSRLHISIQRDTRSKHAIWNAAETRFCTIIISSWGIEIVSVCSKCMLWYAEHSVAERHKFKNSDTLKFQPVIFLCFLHILDWKYSDSFPLKLLFSGNNCDLKRAI